MKLPRRFRSLTASVFLLLAWAAFALPARADGEMGVGCGPPAKGGWVKLAITIARPTLPDGTQVTETAIIELQITGPPDWTAELKAELFRTGLPSEFEGKIELSGEGREVWATGKKGWRVSSMSIFGDETNEPDATLSAVTPTDELGFCSLSGMASGLSASGAPGRFALNAGGHAVMVPTAPGMPAQVVEQQVFMQLLAQGATVRFATAADLALLGAVPHDGTALVIEGLDAAGLAQSLSDTGLTVDLAGLASPVLPAADPVATVPGTEPDGTFVAFGTGSIPPLPGGFFGPGSDPFFGTVCFAGEPLAPPVLGDASTVVQRHGGFLDPWAPPGSHVEIPIEILALNLVSCEPITVTYNGGTQPESWNVQVDLSVSHPSTGTLGATKTHPNGGTFSSTFFVQPRFVFTRVSDQHQVELEAGLPPLLFTAPDGHWVHAMNPALGALAFSDGSFVPGVEEVMPGDPLSQQLRRLHAHEASGAARHTVFPARLPGTAVPSAADGEFWVRCYPNPSNPGPRIVYAMPAPGALAIAIYNLRGERVRALVDRIVDAGAGSVIWDGRDDRGAQTASGIYLCRIEALGRAASTKVALMK